MASTAHSLRKHFRSLRINLSEAEQRAHANLLASHLNQHRSVLNADRIACYLANDGEIDPGIIIEDAWSRDQHIYLPVLSQSGNSLDFALYRPDCELRDNRYGIPEPVVSPQQLLQAEQLDVILLPLVAFDDNGNRMGMGGGFYDRTLEFTRHSQGGKPVLIGLAHEIQRSDTLHTEAWDIPLAEIATEAGIRQVR